jgi:hypothetical protein
VATTGFACGMMTKINDSLNQLDEKQRRKLDYVAGAIVLSIIGYAGYKIYTYFSKSDKEEEKEE